MRNDYLAHHGILGMKWGVRRYQNPDGSLTVEGREHYSYKSEKSRKKAIKYAKSAVGIAATTAVVQVGGKFALKHNLITKGRTYVEMYVAMTKPMLAVGVSSNLVAAGANYAASILANEKLKKKEAK